MVELSRLLLECGIEFDPVDCKIPCFPHIINICVQHIIASYHSVDFSTAPAQWLACNAVIKKESYSEALTFQPVKQGKHLVRVIRASGQRRETFQNTILIGNQGNLFPGGNLLVVELLCDEPTRWDSMYVMLNRLRTLRPVRHYLA